MPQMPLEEAKALVERIAQQLETDLEGLGYNFLFIASRYDEDRVAATTRSTILLAEEDGVGVEEKFLAFLRDMLIGWHNRTYKRRINWPPDSSTDDD